MNGSTALKAAVAGATLGMLLATASTRPAAGAEPQAPKVKASAAAAETEPSPALRAAYHALQNRDYETAARLYQELARSEPRSVDVAIGLAAVSVHRGDYDSARRFYMDALRLDPKNAAAQGGLLALFGRTDYAAAELKLKELLAREPSAFLYHTIGTLYAEQSLWIQAQQAYFQAYHLEPASPDHAFNLAVSLDHIGQRGPARAYYRRAVELARASRAAAFDVAQAEERAARLAAVDGN